jgi:hypothetical protein
MVEALIGNSCGGGYRNRAEQPNCIIPRHALLLGVVAVLVLLVAIVFGGVGGMALFLFILIFAAAGLGIKYLPPSRRARLR